METSNDGAAGEGGGEGVDAESKKGGKVANLSNLSISSLSGGEVASLPSPGKVGRKISTRIMLNPLRNPNHLAFRRKTEDENDIEMTVEGLGGTVAEMEEEKELPVGWERISDPKSGVDYYVNDVSEETTWERPTRPALPPSRSSGLSAWDLRS